MFGVEELKSRAVGSKGGGLLSSSSAGSQGDVRGLQMKSISHSSSGHKVLNIAGVVRAGC